jgi:hypothetical protein
MVREIEIQELLRIARTHVVQLAENDNGHIRGIPDADLHNLVIAMLKAVDRLRPGPPVIPVREMKQT